MHLAAALKIKEDYGDYHYHEKFFDMRGFNLDQLKAFMDVVELGSFSAAAERSGLTQPAVSLQIRQLETRMGVRLLERIGRRATPTAAGTELMQHAARVEDSVAATLDGMARHAFGTIGRVRLGTGATACIYLLPAILKSLRQRFPAIEITVATGNTSDVVKAVEENRLDLGLVTMPAGGRMLEVSALAEDEFVLIEPAGARSAGEATAEALTRRPVLLYEPGANTRRIIDDWFAAERQSLTPVMSLGSVEAIKELVDAGLGCSILPRMAVERDADRARFIVTSLTPHLSRQLVTIVRRDKPVSRAMREMLLALRVATS
jgi:DNA-binding transcriptional LysR family regulator